MQSALETLSKNDLIALLEKKENEAQKTLHLVKKSQEKLAKAEQKATRYQNENTDLQAQLDWFKRQLFGQKRERYEEDPAQGLLPFDATDEQKQAHREVHEETITYVRTRQSRANHKGRLPLPDHLPVEKIRIYPEGDLSGMICIGKEVTEELEMDPARFYIKRYIRYKYARKGGGGGVRVAELPERVIDKGIPGPGLLASILVDKYMDHLPLYRQRQRFLRENIPIAASTLDGWAAQAMDRLEILYDHLLADSKTKGYLQADETPIKVLESRKKGSCHQGYYWVYHCPVTRSVVFDYQPTRGAPALDTILKDFKGYLQTDGYATYKMLNKAQSGKKQTGESPVTHLYCWAHVRRKFEHALDNDRERAETALTNIRRLYAVEWEARKKGLTPAQRKKLRLEESLPVIQQMGKWIGDEALKVLPKSLIGKAFTYALNHWRGLDVYLQDGTLEIDNNLVENAIRPVPLGRKNYLFAGSHKGARRAAMVYSFFGICKMHRINPHDWLKHTLQHILSTKYADIRELYPQNFKG